MKRDDFEYWLFEMDDELEIFLESIDEPIRDNMDYSIDSLKAFEAWILDNFSSIEAIMAEDNKLQLDRMARYVGETMRKSLGGKWDIELEDPDDAYYRLPVLCHEKYGRVCPHTLVTASTDRRKGDYIYRVALARKRRLSEA